MSTQLDDLHQNSPGSRRDSAIDQPELQVLGSGVAPSVNGSSAKPIKFQSLEINDPDESPESYSLELLREAVDSGASDLFLLDEVDQVVVRMKRHGVIRECRRLTTTFGHRLRNYFRAMAGTDVGDYHHPAEGSYWTTIEGGKQVFIRLNAMPTLLGQDLSMRLFDQRQGMKELSDLGYLPQDLKRIQKLLRQTSGLILVAGPTGSGKTTSLYAFLRHLNNGERKIHSLEEPVEYIIPGIAQSQVNLKMDLDFADLLYACMRSAPDVIVVGEIRDQRTAELAVRAGGSGQLVLATIHADSAVGAIQAMLAHGASRSFLSTCITGVIAQRLVRRLCPYCRQSYDVSGVPELLASVRNLPGLSLAAESRNKLYYATGCDHCADEGYFEQTCLAEVIEVGREISNAIANSYSVNQLFDCAVQGGMIPFRHNARALVASGVTTAEEVSRILAGLKGVEQQFTPDLLSAHGGPHFKRDEM